MANNKQEHEGGSFTSLIALVFGFIALLGGLYLLGLAFDAPEGLQAITFVGGILLFTAAYFVPMTMVGTMKKN